MDEGNAASSFISTNGTAEFSVDFLASIIENVGNPIFVKDTGFRFVLVNRAFSDLFGRPKREFLGKTDFDFFPPTEAEFFRRKDEEMFSTGAQITIDEERVTDADGTQHVLATRKVPIRDSGGDVVYLVGIVHEITHLKEIEQALREANDELETRVLERTKALEEAQQELLRKERMAVLGRLSGGVAHEIRAPLSTVQNAVSVVRGEVFESGSEQVKTALMIIGEELQQANGIVRDLVDYARIRIASPVEVDASELLLTLRSLADAPPSVTVEQNVELAVHAYVDFEQVRRALDNLVKNAFEAMPEGGTLWLTASRDGDKISIRVRDSGKGVDSDVVSKVFDPLVTTKGEGLGLGLTLARALIENQGGQLSLEPADGEPGASFLVEVPRVQPA